MAPPSVPITAAANTLPVQATRRARVQPLAPAATPIRVSMPVPIPYEIAPIRFSSREPMA